MPFCTFHIIGKNLIISLQYTTKLAEHNVLKATDICVYLFTWYLNYIFICHIILYFVVNLLCMCSCVRARHVWGGERQREVNVSSDEDVLGLKYDLYVNYHYCLINNVNFSFLNRGIFMYHHFYPTLYCHGVKNLNPNNIPLYDKILYNNVFLLWKLTYCSVIYSFQFY